MRPVPVIIVKVERKIAGALGAGAETAAVSPLAGEGLDEAFGFTVGLGTIWSGAVMDEAAFAAGGGEGVGG